jgi:hypothetical protein
MLRGAAIADRDEPPFLIVTSACHVVCGRPSL